MRAGLLLALTFALVSDADAAAPPAVRLDNHGDPLPPGAVARLGSSRLRHPFGIHGEVAISPDGSKVASLALDLRVWDSRTGKLLATSEPREERSWGLCFSPDGKSVLSGHGSNRGEQVWVWDLATGTRRPLWRDVKERGSINFFAFSHDAKTIAVCCTTREERDVNRIYLAEYPSGKELGVLALDDRTPLSHGMCFDPHGRLVLAAEGVHVFDVKRLREIGRVGGQVSSSAFALSPDGKTAALLVKGKDEATVRLVRLDTGRTTVTAVKGPMRSRMTFSSDGKELLFAARDGPVVALDARTGKQTRVVSDGRGWWPFADLSPGGLWLARSNFQTIEVIDLRTGKPTVTFDDHRDNSPTDVAASPDGKLVATRSKTEVRVWQRDSGKMLRRIAGEDFVPGLRWSADGQQLAVGRPGKFAWYDATTGKLVREIPLPKADNPLQARLTSDGKRVILADYDDHNTTWILDADDGKQRARLQNTRTEFLRDACEGERLMWLRYEDKRASFFVRGLGEKKPIWSAPSEDWSGESRLFASGMVVLSGWRVETWDAIRGRRCGPTFKPVIGPRNWGRSGSAIVALSPDGRTLVLSQLYNAGNFWTFGEVLLCEVASGQVRARLPRLLPRCDGGTFTPDGRHLITSGDGTALVWDVDDLAAHALTGHEWIDLAGDGPTAFAARCSLVAYPAKAVALLAKRLTPSRIDARKVRQLLEGLEDESFDVRQVAERALAALGDEVEEDLRRGLESDPSQERRLRLGRLVRQLETSPERLRRMRAVEVLERVGSAEAVGLLKRLAAGHEGARQTQEARESLARLKTRR